MASSSIPDALGMKALKYGDRPDAEKDRVAAELRAVGRRAEAAMLYEGRPDHPFLQEEKAWAVESGAAFHLFALRRMGVEVAGEDFRACGLAAEARGRWMDARQCWDHLGDDEGMARIAAHLPESLRPDLPAAADEGEEAGTGSTN